MVGVGDNNSHLFREDVRSWQVNLDVFSRVRSYDLLIMVHRNRCVKNLRSFSNDLLLNLYWHINLCRVNICRLDLGQLFI